MLDVYQVWGNFAGVEVRTDPKLRRQQAPITLVEAPALQHLNALLQVFNHFHVVVDDNTLMIADDTPEKRREYESLEVRSFELQHLDAGTATTLLRSLLGVRHCSSNRELRRVAVFDTERRLRIAEQVLRAEDIPLPGVTIEVELLELGVGESRLPARLSAAEWEKLKATEDATTVFQSRLATLHGEAGQLTAIDRLPITGTPLVAGPASTPGSPTVIGTLYQDIGFELEIKPRVHGNEAVTLDIQLLVGNASQPAAGDGGEVTAFTSREIESTLRVDNGETWLLSGFLRAAGAAAPGANLPLLGTLFTPHSDYSSRQIVLALTPRLAASAASSSDLSPTVHIGRNSELLDINPHTAPLGVLPGESDRDSVRERLRERLRNLPRSASEPKNTDSKNPGG